MMDRVVLLQTLKELLEEDRGEPIADLDESATLREGLGLDSVDLISLVMQIQDRFDVVLDSAELEKITTIRSFLDLLQAKLAQTSRAA